MNDPRFEAGQSFEAAEISEIENAIGREIPAEYRSFVNSYGGAFVGGLVDGSPSLPVLRFFCGDGVIRSLEIHSDLREEGILPIARCELGNIYVIKRDGAVHYLNYYGGKTEALLIASDFPSFLSRIVVKGDESTD